MELFVMLKSTTTHIYLETSAKGFAGSPPWQVLAFPLSPPSTETHGLVLHARGSSFICYLQLVQGSARASPSVCESQTHTSTPRGLEIKIQNALQSEKCC